MGRGGSPADLWWQSGPLLATVSNAAFSLQLLLGGSMVLVTLSLVAIWLASWGEPPRRNHWHQAPWLASLVDLPAPRLAPWLASWGEPPRHNPWHQAPWLASLVGLPAPRLAPWLAS